MTGMTKYLLCILLCSAPFCVAAHAQTTITAASCNEGDVQNAVAKATTDGDTVSIPAGTCTWTKPLNAALSNSLTIEGAGAQTPGGGTDQTIIVDDVNHSSGTPDMAFSTTAGKSFRLTGMAFYSDSGNSTVPYNGLVMITGASKSVRVDHCHFNLTVSGSKGLYISGWIYGVTDHCLYDTTAGIVTNEMSVNDPGWSGSAGLYQGDASWSDSDNWGSNKFFFAEDSTFNNGFAYDCSLGGRLVFRHNTVSGQLMAHGLTSWRNRGCRAEEVYDNTFDYTQNGYGSYLIMIESGALLFWGNTSTNYRAMVYADVPRTNNATYTYSAPPNGWGYCGTGITGASSAWDGNTDSTGYPCLDQVGRGKGDMLSGSSFPNVVNSATGTIAWPHQALDPVYVWDNTYNPVPNESLDTLWLSYWVKGMTVTQENRDYYLQVPNYNEPNTTFNGTVGIGQGTLSARPSTCTPGVAYWATDANGGNGELYVCTAANTWTAYYTPYTYPYPSDQSASTPKAPSGLAAMAH